MQEYRLQNLSNPQSGGGSTPNDRGRLYRNAGSACAGMMGQHVQKFTVILQLSAELITTLTKQYRIIRYSNNNYCHHQKHH